MCGLAGLISHHHGLDQMITQMIALLKHRGPDYQNVWTEEGVALGHSRLSILDLSFEGNQPMSYGDGRYWIIYNGEIYNFIEIRKELEQKGYRFKSNTDTEVALAAYVEWGSKCLQKFNGMWALAIWDRLTKELFLSRDRFGIKPLFIYKDQDLFAFSSEMKGLFPAIGNISTNYETIEKFKVDPFSYESTSACLITGIERFPAGHYAIYRNGVFKITKWWDTLNNLPDIPASYEDQVDYFRELFLDSCKIRMRSDVPIATSLSGGLDSSAVTCALKNIKEKNRMRRPQHAFIMSFPGSANDETTYAQKVVAHTGIQADYLLMDPDSVVNQMESIIYHFEELYITNPAPAMSVYGHARESGIYVTLDGHGADELFGGYPHAPLMALGDTCFNNEKIKDLYQVYKNSLGNFGDSTNIQSEFFISLRNAANNLFSINLNKIRDGKDTQLDYLSQHLYYETHCKTLPTILRNFDRSSMANGVEVRMPFMDWRIVAFAFALPWHAKVSNGFMKRIVRDALAPYLPFEVAYRKTKMGLNSPLVDWFNGPMKLWLLDHLNSESFLSSDIVDGRKISSWATKLVYSNRMTWYDAQKIWIEIIPFLWHLYFVKKTNDNVINGQYNQLLNISLSKKMQIAVEDVQSSTNSCAGDNVDTINEEDFQKAVASIKLDIWRDMYFIEGGAISAVLSEYKVKKVAIFGTRKIALYLYKDLARENIKVISFIDNNPLLQNRCLLDSQINSPKWLKKNKGEIDAILISIEGSHDKKIIQQFQEEYNGLLVLSWKDLCDKAIEQRCLIKEKYT